MPKVKASKQTRMVVVPYDPRRRWLLRGLTVLLLIAAFAAGMMAGNHNYEEVVAERDLLRHEADAARDASNKHRKRVAQLAIDSEVDQRATDAARESMADMRQEIAALKSEISFYKGLMAPTKEERGLGIRSMDLLATKNTRKFAFKLVLQQLAVEHRLVRGDVQINVVGRQEGAEKTLPLSALSEQVANELIKFKFKYFQNIQADLLLPEGFEPQRIDVVVKSKGKKSLEKKFAWLTQEA
jgi:hypothetical protein